MQELMAAGRVVCKVPLGRVSRSAASSGHRFDQDLLVATQQFLDHGHHPNERRRRGCCEKRCPDARRSHSKSVAGCAARRRRCPVRLMGTPRKVVRPGPAWSIRPGRDSIGSVPTRERPWPCRSTSFRSRSHVSSLTARDITSASETKRRCGLRSNVSTKAPSRCCDR